jgi:hypothetical protein
MADPFGDVPVLPVSDLDGEQAEGDSPRGQQDEGYIEERLAELNLTGASIRDSCPGDTGRSQPGGQSIPQQLTVN